MGPDKPKIKKRKYSRGGCQECKRRKMKCDEGKPFCYNCSRLKKVCVYDNKSKFKFETNGGEPQIHPPAPPLPPPSAKADAAFVPVDFKSEIPVMSFPSVKPPEKERPFRNNIVDILSPDTELLSLHTKDMHNLFDEASLLVSDINHLVSVDLALENHDLFQDVSMKDHAPKVSETPARSPQYSQSSMSDSFERHNFQIDDFTDRIQHETESSVPGTVEQLQYSNSELIAQVISYNNLVGPHVTYLKALASTDLSYHMFPFASSVESNEVVKLLLLYSKLCPYLLTSLLAISATFQYNSTGKKVHELTRQKYVLVCLRSLSDEFASAGDKNTDKLANDIERLLLTVLVLTSNFTSMQTKGNLLHSWKTHLRGAKDLLVSYTKITKNTRATGFYMSGGLALAKIWFFAIESLAGLILTAGGTLTKKQKLEDEVLFYNRRIFLDTGYFSVEANPDYHDALVRVGLQTSFPGLHEFNLYVGYCVSYVYLIQEFTGCLELLRANNNQQLAPGRISKLMSLVHNAKLVFVAPDVNLDTFVIPESSAAHPNYPLSLHKITLPQAGYGSDPANNVVYLWFDYSHHVHVDGIYTRMLVTPGLFHLPPSHTLVQSLVRRILDTTFYIRRKPTLDDPTTILAESEHFFLPKKLFDERCIMMQSLFRLCAGLALDDIDLEKVELYFTGLVKIGNGSALIMVDKVRELRHSDRLGGWSIDVLGEMEHVPFA